MGDVESCDSYSESSCQENFCKALEGRNVSLCVTLLAKFVNISLEANQRYVSAVGRGNERERKAIM